MLSRLVINFLPRSKLCTVSKNKTRLRCDCGSGHELLIAKFRLKLKKVGKTTKPFRYDLNQIHYNNYTVKVTNRFKGLDLIGRVPEELWTEVHDIVLEAVIKIIPRKRKCKKANKCILSQSLQKEYTSAQTVSLQRCILDC